MSEDIDMARVEELAGKVIGDVAGSYGDRWAAVLTGPPASAYYATRSGVAVYPGHRIVEQSKPARGASV